MPRRVAYAKMEKSTFQDHLVLVTVLLGVCIWSELIVYFHLCL